MNAPDTPNDHEIQIVLDHRETEHQGEVKLALRAVGPQQVSRLAIHKQLVRDGRVVQESRPNASSDFYVSEPGAYHVVGITRTGSTWETQKVSVTLGMISKNRAAEELAEHPTFLLQMAFDHHQKEHEGELLLHVDMAGSWPVTSLPIFFELYSGSEVVAVHRVTDTRPVPRFFVRKPGTYRIVGTLAQGSTLETQQVTVTPGMIADPES